MSTLIPALPPRPGETLIDARGMYVIPGGVDAHTHLDMPLGDICSSDDFETGTRAAAFGGTTTIVDFATQARGTRMRDAFDTWMKKAEGRATIDYGLHMIVTDLAGGGLEDMDDMVREGVASFKLFMAYPHSLMVDDGVIFKALSQTAKNGALVLMHAENGSVIDVIVARALAEGRTRPSIMPSRGPHAPRARPCIAPSRWLKLPACPSTSCTSPARTRSGRCVRRATVTCPPSLRPARNISCSRSTISPGPASRAPNTC